MEGRAGREKWARPSKLVEQQRKKRSQNVFSFSFRPAASLNHTPARCNGWRCVSGALPAHALAPVGGRAPRHQTQHGTTALTTVLPPHPPLPGNAQKSAIARAKNAEKAKAAGKGEKKAETGKEAASSFAALRAAPSLHHPHTLQAPNSNPTPTPKPSFAKCAAPPSSARRPRPSCGSTRVTSTKNRPRSNSVSPIFVNEMMR